MAAIVLYFHHTQATSQSVNTKIKEVITEETAPTVQTKKIVSKYGFTVEYDSEQLSGHAHVIRKESTAEYYQADTYDDHELGESRGYNKVEFTFKKPEDDSNSGDKSARFNVPPHLSITTSRVNDYFNRDEMPEEFRDEAKYSKLDLMVVAEARQIEKNNPKAKHTTSDLTISGKKFKRMVVVRQNTFNNETYETGRDYVYMTVQNNRPYWLRIYVFGSHRDWAPQISQLETVIANVTFQKPDSSLLIGEAPMTTFKIANSSVNDDLSDKESMNTLEELDEDSLIPVVVRNQIATVRVGSIRCADLQYTAANGAQLTLEGLCSGGIGSGSIVSTDGYVATNGHVTEISNKSLFRNMSTWENWQAYAKFLVAAGYASQADVDALFDRASNDDDEALATLFALIDKVPSENVRSLNEKLDYVVQTSDEPIRIDKTSTGDWRWYNSSIMLPAKKIAAEVDMNSYTLDINGVKSDVAILKIEGEFPAVELGKGSSVKKYDRLTAIGYPATVDDGTSTTKLMTVPTVTQGNLMGVMYDGGGNRLFVMTTQIAAGNSGGPAFAEDGKQIGINTYGGAQCEGESDGNGCFGKGVARDIEDLRKLARKNNISLSAEGQLTDIWKKGLDEFSQGRYEQARQYFEELNEKYPNNYLVKRMIAISTINTPDVEQAVVGVPSQDSTLLTVIIVLTVIFGMIFITVSIIVAVVVARSKRQHYAYPPQLPKN